MMATVSVITVARTIEETDSERRPVRGWRRRRLGTSDQTSVPWL